MLRNPLAGKLGRKAWGAGSGCLRVYNVRDAKQDKSNKHSVHELTPKKMTSHSTLPFLWVRVFCAFSLISCNRVFLPDI